MNLLGEHRRIIQNSVSAYVQPRLNQGSKSPIIFLKSAVTAAQVNQETMQYTPSPVASPGLGRHRSESFHLPCAEG